MADQTEVERLDAQDEQEIGIYQLFRKWRGGKKRLLVADAFRGGYAAGYEAGARAMRERAAKHCDPLDFIIAKDLRSLPLTEGK